MEEIGISVPKGDVEMADVEVGHAVLIRVEPCTAILMRHHLFEQGVSQSAPSEEDLYVQYKTLQRQLEFLQVQEDYIKVREGGAKCALPGYRAHSLPSTWFVRLG